MCVDMDNLKSPADDPGMAKDFANPAGECVGGYVKIFGLKACQKISYSPTHDEGLETLTLKTANYTFRVRIDQGWIDMMIFCGIYFCLFYRLSFRSCSITNEQCFTVQIVLMA